MLSRVLDISLVGVSRDYPELHCKIDQMSNCNHDLYSSLEFLILALWGFQENIPSYAAIKKVTKCPTVITVQIVCMSSNQVLFV